MALFMGLYVLVAFTGLVFTSLKGKVTIVGINNKKINTEKIYVFVAFFIMTIMCGLRSMNVGTDTRTYVNIFLNPSLLNSVVSGGINKFEFGYIYYVQLLRLISNDPQFFIFVTALITFWCTYIFVIRNCESCYSLAVIIYMSFLYYTNFSALRQSIALAIAINSIEFIRKRQLLKASILIILGGSFHYTAFILFVFIPLSLTEWTKKKVTMAVCLSIGGLLLFDQLISIVLRFFPVYARYWESGMMSEDDLSKIGVFAILILIVCIYSIVKLFTQDNVFLNEIEKKEYIIALSGSIFCLVINIIGRQNGIFSRMSRYFIPYVIILIGYLYKYYFKKMKILFYLLVIAIMGGYFYLRMKNNLYQIIPYEFFWSCR